MASRTLKEPMRAYRIGDPKGKFPIFSAEGTARQEGRWHAKGQAVIYASNTYSTAMLEKLAHFNGVLPDGQHFLEITIPVGASYEVVTADILPGWTAPSIARPFGSKWLTDNRSAILVVPSFVARLETNVLINPAHPDFKTIKTGLETPIWWDRRLFADSD